MPAKYKDLSKNERAALAEVLRHQSGSLPFGDPVYVFNTLLFVLWERRPIRGSHGRGYSHSSKLSEAIWHWTEAQELGPAWRAYLKLQNDARLGQWVGLFDFYADSWQDREEAKKQASKVHSMWFRTMHDTLRREAARRKKARTVKK